MSFVVNTRALSRSPARVTSRGKPFCFAHPAKGSRRQKRRSDVRGMRDFTPRNSYKNMFVDASRISVKSETVASKQISPVVAKPHPPTTNVVSAYLCTVKTIAALETANTFCSARNLEWAARRTHGLWRPSSATFNHQDECPGPHYINIAPPAAIQYNKRSSRRMKVYALRPQYFPPYSFSFWRKNNIISQSPK